MQTGFHAPDGGFDFIGMRKREDALEIVYDDGVSRRMVWRVRGKTLESQLEEALARASRQLKVLPALYAELRRRSIAIEAVLH